MSIKRTAVPLGILSNKDGADNQDLIITADRFRKRFEGHTASVDARKAETTTMVNEYYDMVTDFYEYGWGQAFHFAPRYVGETFYEGLSRHEYFLALQSGFKEGMKILDIGCGIGGPARNIARFTDCHIMGVNINAYQISRARRYDEQLGLHNKIDYTKADFCVMPFKDGEYDGAYAIEATCHASDKVKCFSEIFRVLKPGANFCCYEWIITPKYDDSNAEHRRIRHGIELGNSLPTLETGEMVVAAMKKAGFIVENFFDVVGKFVKGRSKQINWYNPLESDYTTLNGIKSTPIGRYATMMMCSILELVRLAPKGSRKAANILEEAAINLLKGGQLGIFTPCFFVLARKPE